MFSFCLKDFAAMALTRGEHLVAPKS